MSCLYRVKLMTHTNLKKSKHTVRLCEGVYVGFSMYICIYVCLYCNEKN